ncbi:MAG: DUF2007 domain-containing protein [Thermoanaerobacterales bacterium]|nr:DUF2007 domain-containing protein [Bacillota bacterium]MDI6906942.1 DUF2007 domain-containing protein [Thermoanaerobacterales bacterium]
MWLVKVKNFPSRMFAEQAEQILKGEGIPAVIVSPDTGITGTTGSRVVQGADLYVPEQFAERAKELVTALFNGI